MKTEKINLEIIKGLANYAMINIRAKYYEFGDLLKEELELYKKCIKLIEEPSKFDKESLLENLESLKLLNTEESIFSLEYSKEFLEEEGLI